MVLWVDGAEIGRALLAGVAVAAWLVGFIAALNWYNKQRQQQVIDIIRQMPTGPDAEASTTTSTATDSQHPAEGSTTTRPGPSS